jgi:hypothetical protein
MFLIGWIGGSWQATATLVAGTLLVYLGALWLTLIFWTYRDARRRSRSTTFQLAAVGLVTGFFVPGLWLYLLMRPRLTLTQQYAAALEEEALLQELDDVLNCAGCNRRVREEYLVCPSCLIELKTPCEECEKPLAHAWLACPFCGKRRFAEAPAAAASPVPERGLKPEEIPAMAPSQTPAGVSVGGGG